MPPNNVKFNQQVLFYIHNIHILLLPRTILR